MEQDNSRNRPRALLSFGCTLVIVLASAFASAVAQEKKPNVHQVAQSRVGSRAGTTGLALAARSSSALKVDPQVAHRHPVIEVRAASPTVIREGLKDKASSPPHCKQKRSKKRPLSWAYNTPALFS